MSALELGAWTAAIGGLGVGEAIIFATAPTRVRHFAMCAVALVMLPVVWWLV